MYILHQLENNLQKCGKMLQVLTVFKTYLVLSKPFFGLLRFYHFPSSLAAATVIASNMFQCCTITQTESNQTAYITNSAPTLHPGIRMACYLGYMQRTRFLLPAQGKVPGHEAESAVGRSTVGSRSTAPERRRPRGQSSVAAGRLCQR